MDLIEITSLIKIREYIFGAINNFSIQKETVRTLNNMLSIIDKRIVDKILSDDFKELLGYEDASEILAEVRKVSNIKSGMSFDENKINASYMAPQKTPLIK